MGSGLVSDGLERAFLLHSNGTSSQTDGHQIHPTIDSPNEATSTLSLGIW
jgi:hypothetical protein